MRERDKSIKIMFHVKEIPSFFFTKNVSLYISPITVYHMSDFFLFKKMINLEERKKMCDIL